MSKSEHFLPNCASISVSIQMLGKRVREGVGDTLVTAGPTGGYARMCKEQSEGHLAMWARRSVIQCGERLFHLINGCILPGG